MESFFKNEQLQATARIVGVSFGSILAALSIISPDGLMSLKSGFQNMWDGAALFAKGVTVVIPVVLGAIGVVKSSLASKKKSVIASGSLVVTPTDHETTPQIAASIANLNDIHKVEVAPSVAVTVPSAKVVAP